MSTSANLVEYHICKNNEHVGHYRQNMMCKSNYSSLLKYQPLNEHTIMAYGYDEEEEYWESKEQNLETFMKKKAIFEKEIKEYFQENK